MYFRALFAEKNLVFVNFKYNLNFFNKFENQLKSIDLVLLNRMNSLKEFQEKYINITDYLGEKQVCILSEDTNCYKFYHLLKKNLNYGIVLGCKYSGKKTIMKEMSKILKYEIISVANIVKKIKEKKEEAGEIDDNEDIEFDKNIEELTEEEREFYVIEFKKKTN